MNFDDIRLLSQEACSEKDERPEWLKQMPGAMDPSERYYKFLWLLAAALKPGYSLEIGTRCGTSALHIAAGNPAGLVHSIDIQDCTEVMNIGTRNGVTNCVVLVGDSTKSAHLFVEPVDLLFIDGDHTYISSYTDYLSYRPLVKDGGLIVFDDTRYNDGLIAAWHKIADEKMEFIELHYMGFGIAIKTPGATVLPI